jgi:hypothetical protein
LLGRARLLGVRETYQHHATDRGTRYRCDHDLSTNDFHWFSSSILRLGMFVRVSGYYTKRTQRAFTIEMKAPLTGPASSPIGHQGLKPLLLRSLDVAAEAATHKDYS